MTQTLAIFLDAYRDLNAKKLFWIVMGLSGLVALVFLALGIDEKGLSFLWMHFWPAFNTTRVPRGEFYVKILFFRLGVDFWLAIFATILAIVSTAGIFPDLITSGTIDLYLSRPIGRLRLFITRYVAAMLFVALQVGAFCFGCFFVLGLRGGTWKPGIFLAIPVLVVFFSYLYCVCVLIGLLTRSTIASLLITLLFWAAIFGIHVTEQFAMGNLIHNELAIERLDPIVKERAEKLAKFDAEGGEATQLQRRVPMLQALTRARLNLEMAHASKASSWHGGVYALKTYLPKTSETVELLNRWLKQATDVELEPEEANGTDLKSDAPAGSIFDPLGADRLSTMKRSRQVIESRSVGWVIGTSLAFEGVILGLAAWIFCRRDY